MTSHDIFRTNRPGRRTNRPRRDRAPRSHMYETLNTAISEMLPLVCADGVLLAEVGAANGCIGWYVQQLFGSGESEFGATAPEPLLRVIDTFGADWQGDPLALVICARALVRLTADPAAHELAERISRRWGQSSRRRPPWFELPLVVPQQAWLARMEEGLDTVVTSWRDANGEEHAFAVLGPDPDKVDGDIGTCPSDLILGGSGEELIIGLSEPVGEEPGMSFEPITLDRARETLAAAIDDVPLASNVLAPGDLPLPVLAFLEHRRDLL